MFIGPDPGVIYGAVSSGKNVFKVLIPADEIFASKTYSKWINDRQSADKNLSFEDSAPPQWYLDENEPTTLSGEQKGLYVIADSHYDKLARFSVDSDFWGLSGLIHSGSSFPLISHYGFHIRTGHNNLIAIRATNVKASESLKDLSLTDRRCKFEHEIQNLTLYKKYSQTNCLLECFLLNALQQFVDSGKRKCTPWYFPFAEKEVMHLCIK